MAGNQGKGAIFDLDGTLLDSMGVFGIRLTSIFFQNEALTCRTIT